jgi:fructoselysine-6-P-deglycase FrlB-like protein
VIAQASDVVAPPDEVENAEQCTFLGSGWAYGVALEAGLKMREAAGSWTESYPQLEYRHGPISIAQPGRAVWVFGTPAEGILRDIRATGATVVADDLDPVADLVRVQALAVRRAERLGLDPDRPRALTRSVVLDQDGSA